MPKLENWIKMSSLLLWLEEILIMSHLIHPSIEKIMFMKDTRTVWCISEGKIVLLKMQNHVFWSIFHFSYRFSAEYSCPFNLRFFPFDQQTCIMEFKARTVTKNYLTLVPGKLKYKGPEVLVEFIVSNITLGTGIQNTTRSEVRIVIEFERQYTYHLSQSYFQSFLLGFLAYLTFWIDVSDFTDRFMGSLTALLVLASLMSSLTSQLPKTSYFKVILLLRW